MVDSPCYTEGNKTCIRVHYFIYGSSHRVPQLHQLFGWEKGLSFLLTPPFWYPQHIYCLWLRLLSVKSPHHYSHQFWQPRVSHVCSHISDASNCLYKYSLLTIYIIYIIWWKIWWWQVVIISCYQISICKTHIEDWGKSKNVEKLLYTCL